MLTKTVGSALVTLLFGALPLGCDGAEAELDAELRVNKDFEDAEEDATGPFICADDPAIQAPIPCRASCIESEGKFDDMFECSLLGPHDEIYPVLLDALIDLETFDAMLPCASHATGAGLSLEFGPSAVVFGHSCDHEGTWNPEDAQLP